MVGSLPKIADENGYGPTESVGRAAKETEKKSNQFTLF